MINRGRIGALRRTLRGVPHPVFAREAHLSGADENAKNEADNTQSTLDRWYNVKVMTRAEFNVGDKDFTPQILKVKQANPELIVAPRSTPALAAVCSAVSSVSSIRSSSGSGRPFDTLSSSPSAASARSAARSSAPR